jgi:hypothetical protein
VFERISDGLRSVAAGDMVRLATKPALLGSVLHFSVPQVGGGAAGAWCMVSCGCSTRLGWMCAVGICFWLLLAAEFYCVMMLCTCMQLSRGCHLPVPPRLQVLHGEGCYSNGRVTIRPVPEEVHGAGALQTWPLRRIEEVVSGEAAEEHCRRELAKVRLACVCGVWCGLCGIVLTQQDAHHTKHGLLCC